MGLDKSFLQQKRSAYTVDPQNRHSLEPVQHQDDAVDTDLRAGKPEGPTGRLRGGAQAKLSLVVVVCAIALTNLDVSAG